MPRTYLDILKNECAVLVPENEFKSYVSPRADKTPQRPAPYDAMYEAKPLREALAAAFESAPKRSQ